MGGTIYIYKFIYEILFVSDFKERFSYGELIQFKRGVYFYPLKH